MLNNYNKISFQIIVLLLVGNISSADPYLENQLQQSLQDLKTQRKSFLQAEEELKKSNNVTKVLKKFNHLSHYPLYPYLEFIALQKDIKNVNLATLNKFVEKNSGTPLANPIKEAWLLHNAKLQKWDNFLKGYTATDNIELQCYYIQASNKYNKDLAIFDEKIKNIWLNQDSQPKSCDVVFDSWRQQGLMTKAMIWQRIKLAISFNKIAFARYLSTKYLLKQEQSVVDLWIKVHNNPMLIIQKHYFLHNTHPAVPEILIYGILKIAKKDQDHAIKIWHVLSKIYKFTDRHFNYIVRGIAVALAKNAHPNALDWLDKVPKEYRDQEVHNLKLILSLKQYKWSSIIALYENLPMDLQVEEKWLYWYARALDMYNRGAESKKILMELSTRRSYYGFLASAKLLRPYSFKFKPVAIKTQQMDNLLKNKSIQRAYELLKIERINKANKEWSIAIRYMQEWELHAAAKLADSLNMPNWAITALSDAKDKDDLSLRFPKYYSRHIVNEAKRNRLDPAWVFAVTRQESAFKPNVKSYAGALGLMQVMPKTGFMVAKKMNLKLRNHRDILDIDNNVKLGSKYLQLMLDRYKNIVVATAAYNAGPGRIEKWLPDYDISADIWVETIPFKDTREYVQHVMAYTVVYQKLLGHNHYLNMPLIKKSS